VTADPGERSRARVKLVLPEAGDLRAGRGRKNFGFPHLHTTCGGLTTNANEADASDQPTAVPGIFVTAELAEGCADFLAKTRKTILRLQEVGLLPEARAYEVSHETDPPPPAK
jgi:hypothetical protein